MKIFKYLFTTVMIFCIYLTSVYADVTIGAGPGGGYNAGGDWPKYHNNPFGTPKQYRGYKIRLIYYDGSDPSGVRGESAWQEITSFDVVISDLNVAGTNYTNLVRLHGQNNTKLGLIDNNAKPNLYWLGQQVAYVENGTTNEERIKSEIEANDSARLRAIIRELGVDESTMTKESVEEMGWNHKGYRFIAEKLIIMTDVGWFFANSRKELAQVIPNDRSGNVTSFYEGLWELRTLANGSGVFPGDIRTTKDDINVRYNGANWNYNNFRNYNSGIGLGIISIGHNPYAEKDYTIDAACVNCNSDDDENKAYIIQDTNDWDAIMSSRQSSNKNVTSYYNKGNGVYCREEYWVYLPNVNNTIYVDPGRYFTLNPSAADLSAMDSSSAIPNFKPIKVTKKRECRVNTEENGSNASTVLDTFRRNSEYDFKGKTGTVKFKYNEVYDESRYNMKEPEKLSVYDEPNNYNYSINGNSLTMEVTRYYTLPDNYYQYIRKQDGLSMKTKPSSNINHYLNVGIPNLPLSFNNKGGSTNGEVSKAADIQFSFELPGKNNDTDQYSKLYLAYIQNNSYLATDNESGNIYNRYLTGQMEAGDQDLLNKSACAKMFGVNTSGFSTCVKKKKNNAIGEGSNSCITKNNISSSSTTSGYSCMVLTSEPDDPPGTLGECKTEEDAKRLGRDWNPYSQSCCPVGTTYNPSLGKCEPDDDTNTCHIKNGKYYDFDGKEITKEEYDRICPDPGDGDTCRIENGKYYDFNGNEITKEEFDKICPGYVPPVCPEDECPYGCCPSGECAPMPDGTCPGTGGIDVIYRTIDLENPFPGQNAEQRNTGANWCSYNIKTQQIDCKYNNQIVKNYITRERSGTTNGGKVYREDHVLYEVTLDTKTINAIRAYNNKNKYDDWDLNCLDNGKACISDFLRSQVDTTGECANASKSTFYTCDEDV